MAAAKPGLTYDPMDWFRAGIWYSDALAFMVLVLPENDPTLAEILDSMRSGTFYESEGIAKNVLRYGMARGEMAEFREKIQAESALLHVRGLFQNSIKNGQALTESAAPSASLRLPQTRIGFYAFALRIVSRMFFYDLPRMSWMLGRALLRSLTMRRRRS